MLNELFSQAQKAAAQAYAPYSGFRVGAALKTDDGRVFVGANVENRSFGLTICAERAAVTAAIAAGSRRFVAVAIAALDSASPVGPCGACRQVLSEFMEAKALVRFGGTDGQQIDCRIEQLLPYDSLQDLAERL